MGLSDDLKDLMVVKKPQCRFRSILESVSDEDRAVLEKAIDLKDDHGKFVVSGATLNFKIRKNGHQIGDRAVYSHRDKDCSCFEVSK